MNHFIFDLAQAPDSKMLYDFLQFPIYETLRHYLICFHAKMAQL